MPQTFLAALAAALILLTPASFAQDYEERMDVAREIVRLGATKEIYRASLELSMPLARQTFEASFPNASDAQLDESLDVMMDILMTTYDDMVDETAVLYAERFTLDELETVLEFNRTPIGQKVTQEMPSIMAEAGVIGERLGSEAVTRDLARLQAVFNQ